MRRLFQFTSALFLLLAATVIAFGGHHFPVWMTALFIVFGLMTCILEVRLFGSNGKGKWW